MSENIKNDDREILDLTVENVDSVRGGATGAGAGKVSMQLTGDPSSIMKQILDPAATGDPSQWGVSSLNFAKIEV